MRFSFLLLGVLAGMLSMAAVSVGAEPSKPAQPSLSPIPMDQQAQPAADASSGELLCEDEEIVCQRRIRPYGKLLDKWASYGQFNCGCSGSYKYPAPPQYTYHWPGMYSQPTMTQYVSPYRFPPLRAPPKGEDLLEPGQEPNENVSERITTRPIRPVSVHRPINP